jgi:hypothetical protein
VVEGRLNRRFVAAVEAVQQALEKAGIEFTDGDKPGVRVK